MSLNPDEVVCLTSRLYRCQVCRIGSFFSTFGRCLSPNSGRSRLEPVCAAHNTCARNRAAVPATSSRSSCGAMAPALCAGNNGYIWHGTLKLWTVFKKLVIFTSLNSSGVKQVSGYWSENCSLFPTWIFLFPFLSDYFVKLLPPAHLGLSRTWCYSFLSSLINLPAVLNNGREVVAKTVWTIRVIACRTLPLVIFL